MEPIISVIMPCHNYGRYLEDAIHSLVGGKTSLGDFEPQTFQHFEIIIVDDASTDGTAEFAQPFLNERIHFIRNENNLGTSATLNVGIRQSKGRFITFLSADDMMETTRLEKMYRAQMDFQNKVIYDDLMTFGNGKRKDRMTLADYDFERLVYKNIMHAGILYSRRAWEEVGGYPEAFTHGREDWAFNVALGSHGYCGVHIREPLYLYRWEGQNRSLRNAGSQMRLQFLSMMQAQYPALYRGERTNMCCGSKAKSTAIARSTSSRRGIQSVSQRQITPLVGAEGMVILEYQLPKAGRVLYTGAVTGQQYAFGGQYKTNYVDARDAPALLARIEDRRHAFILAEVSQPVIEPMPAEKQKEFITEVIPNAVILAEIENKRVRRGKNA